MADRQRGSMINAPQHAAYSIKRRERHWEVRDPDGQLVCLTVYKCGAQEVVRRMSLVGAAGVGQTTA